MRLPAALTQDVDLKILSLAAAVVLWAFVSYGAASTRTVRLPIEVRNLAPGLTVAGGPLPAVEVTLSGHKSRLWRYGQKAPHLVFDLTGVGAGTVAFPHMEKLVDVPSGVSVVRIHPSALEFSIVRRADAGH